MRPIEIRAPKTWNPYPEDLGSDEFFELDFSKNAELEDNEEIGDGFDHQSYDRALRFRRFALQLLGLN